MSNPAHIRFAGPGKIREWREYEKGSEVNFAEKSSRENPVPLKSALRTRTQHVIQGTHCWPSIKSTSIASTATKSLDRFTVLTLHNSALNQGESMVRPPEQKYQRQKWLPKWDEEEYDPECDHWAVCNYISD
jgi:hypothetical protein